MAKRQLSLALEEVDVLNKHLARPFLKWAGGKTQLLQKFERFFPVELKQGKIDEYFEPFIGGGAVFFYIAQRYRVKEAYLYDINKELILAYKAVQNDIDKLIILLQATARKYLGLTEDARKEYYYKIRDMYNQERLTIDYSEYSTDWVRRAAQLIFLNRTCFNGLFRVNSKGEFNVPFGRYKNPVILDEKNLRAASKLLKGVVIEHGDFMSIKDKVTSNSFVYFDPPYRPINKTSSFTSYSTFEFNDEQQIRLAKLYKELNKKGVKLMLSNSDPENKNDNDDFFENHYRGANIRIYKVPAYRMINCNGAKRGQINELVIINYEVEG